MTIKLKPGATNKEAMAGLSSGNAVKVTKESPIRMIHEEGSLQEYIASLEGWRT